MERDFALAERTLEELKAELSESSGRRRGSLTRRTNTLAERIERFRGYVWPPGLWHSHTEFRTEHFEDVEKRAHQILSDHLDKDAPLGEIFSCSPGEAVQAVEASLRELGMLETATKTEVPQPQPSENVWDLSRRHLNLERLR